jgi:hypothetical protein
MKDSPRPSPPWLKWALRILGVLLLLCVLGRLPFALIHSWKIFHHAKAAPALTSPVALRLAGEYVAMLIGTFVAVWLWRRSARKMVAPAEPAAAPDGSAEPAPVRPTPSPARPPSRRWSLCNVLSGTGDPRRVWQFDAHSKDFGLNREETVRSGEPLPLNLVGKSWSSLWQSKLNVAWLPAEDVFIRVAQFPESSPEETRAMVELQLEKLSPVPVTQAVWTMQVLPPAAAALRRKADGPGAEAGKMQTVVVTIVARDVVEEFLGRLEGQGYLADRLELPLLDQLQATAIKEDGAWIYPAGGARNTALVAWWYGGVLQNLDLLQLPPGADRAAALKDQLMQMAWAGELEGWLATTPSWHLVADEAIAKEWALLLREGLEQPVEFIAPLSATELAGLTARRSTQTDPRVNLLPAEFATRYRQRFVDRLWLRGLLAALALYGVGCVVYFIAVLFLGLQTRKVESQVADRGFPYTNVMQLKARYGVLKERQDLKYAALDCWQATAELMPEGLTLDSLNFSDGRKLSLNGTVPAQQLLSASDFSGKLRKYRIREQPLFDATGDAFSSRVNPGMATATWSFGLDLKRAEAP